MAPRNTRGRRPACSGFTIAEILVTTLILGIAVISATWTMSGSVQAKAILAESEVTASLMAHEIHTLAEVLPREPSGTTGATSAADVVALDCLIGAVLTPPMNADGTTDSAHVGWVQQVDLTVYSLSDLTTPTGDSAADGLPEDGNRLYKLSVVVLDPGGDTAGTFSWWLNP